MRIDTDLQLAPPFELSPALRDSQAHLAESIADFNSEADCLCYEDGTISRRLSKPLRNWRAHLNYLKVVNLQAIAYDFLPMLRAEFLTAIHDASAAVESTAGRVRQQLGQVDGINVEHIVATHPDVMAAQQKLNELCRWDGITHLSANVDRWLREVKHDISRCEAAQ